VSDNPNISLSIAAVCYQTDTRELQELFESILAAAERLREHYNYESISVYLIDNSTEEQLSLNVLAGSSARAKELNIELRLLHGHGNIGYGSGHNKVIDNLANYHLMLNSDVVLDENCLLSGVSFLEENADICMISPSATDARGKTQYLCKRYPSIFTFFLRGFLPSMLKKPFARRLARYEMHEQIDDNSSEEPVAGIPIISGCFMLCRTAAFTAVKGFDEKYFLYFEDFDLSLRMREQGVIAHVPAMKIVHGGGHAAKKGINHVLIFIRSGIRFYSRHGWRWFSE